MCGGGVVVFGGVWRWCTGVCRWSSGVWRCSDPVPEQHIEATQ